MRMAAATLGDESLSAALRDSTDVPAGSNSRFAWFGSGIIGVT